MIRIKIPQALKSRSELRHDLAKNDGVGTGAGDEVAGLGDVWIIGPDIQKQHSMRRSVSARRKAAMGRDREKAKRSDD